MEAKMTEALLTAVVRETVSKVISVVAEQVNLAWGFKEELQRLGNSLQMIAAFLQDAEQRQRNDNSVKLWLERLKDVAYEADDVLDEFGYEVLRRKVEIQNQMRKKVRDFCSSSNPISFRLKMANKIKDILKSLDDLNKLANQFGLQYRSVVHITPVFPQSNVETVSFLDETKIVGRENDTSKIVDLLINPNNEQVVSVVPIVGMAGLGKTTLAKIVYNDADVDRHFDKKFWVCVSDNFDVRRILREMLDHFPNQQILISDSMNAMIEKLKEKMEQAKMEKEQFKYLLVLDDVWNVEKWEELKLFLTGANKNRGNRIIVTTRSQDVASKVQILPNQRHQPGRLEDDECWSIIKETAFRGFPMSQELEPIGKRIAEKCQGVPLVAKVIGGTMCKIEMSHGAWLKIQNSDVWDSVESVLKLSFDHLSSPSLQKCFAYCSMFPKDFCFEKEQLIQLWMAEGFLQAPRESSITMMDIGNKYFSELVSNSLFQDVELDNCRNVLTCKMHDMVHDLAVSVSKFETLIFEGNSTPIADEVSHIRHLNITHDGEPLPKILTAVTPRLRSLFSKIDVFKKMSLTLKSLRVLNFCGAVYILELPDSLGKLKHLRYLDISNTFITALPQSTTKLYNLQTLRFMDCQKLTLPDGLRNLICLKHIHFDHERLQPLELRHLTSLQTLPMFAVQHRLGSQSCHSIDALKCLNRLRGELYICNLGNVRDKDEAMEADLCEKSKLDKLILEWGSTIGSYCGREDHVDVLEGLQPHKSLQRLIIRNYLGANFPSWMLRPVHGSSTGLFLLNNLIELELIDCIHCESLPPLGQLQNLKFLTLKKMKVKCMGNEFYCNARSHGRNEAITVFPALKRFTLSEMDSLKEWTAMAARVMFPSLEELDIFWCPFLRSIPLTGQCLYLEKLSIKQCLQLSNIGEALCNSMHLKELTIEWCSNLCSIPNLNGISTLQSLYVSSCDKLEIVPLSGRYPSLEKLHISSCKNLSKIGDRPSFSTCLKELLLKHCPNLSSIPDLEGFSSLRNLDVSYCNKLEIVPITGRCSSLEKFSIYSCSRLSKIGDGLSASSGLKELCLSYCPNLSSFPDLEGLLSLRRLQVICCYKLEKVPITGPLSSLGFAHIDGCETKSNIEDVLHTSTCLKSLTIRDCMYLTSVPRLFGFSSLATLIICRCPWLTSFPICGDFSSLQKLDISDCRELSYIGDGLSTSRRLEKLSIRCCPSLRSISALHGLSSLTELDLTEAGEGSTCLLSNLLQSSTSLRDLTISSLPDLLSITEDLGNLRSLYHLTIMECPRLLSISDDSLGSLTSLRELKIGGFSKDLEDFPALNSVQHLSSSLRYLYLTGWEKLNSLPRQLQHLNALEELTIERFQGIKALPEWLGSLSSLEALRIISCDNLMYLPSRDVMRSLSRLFTFRIIWCPLLETRCSVKTGPRWSLLETRCSVKTGPEYYKISHIPEIWINDMELVDRWLAERDISDHGETSDISDCGDGETLDISDYGDGETLSPI